MSLSFDELERREPRLREAKEEAMREEKSGEGEMDERSGLSDWGTKIAEREGRR